MDKATELTVSQISSLIKRNIEQNFSYVKIRGEVSGLKRAPSGHVYLSLKDSSSVLAAVCWRGIFDSLKIKPEEGMEVICTGSITTFPGQSKYQLNIEAFEHSGIGSLMAMLETRKKSLAAEGLFDISHKKKIPLLPKLIGIVTSPTGSVIRDIIHRVTDRCPTDILIWPVLVQGNEAANQITEAINGFNQLKNKPDIIIVARGGGSIEDLWCFNEENVVRAVFASSIPIVSAVGHETDITLIDFVADLRAPTPTAAAELTTPVLQDLKSTLSTYATNLYRTIHKLVHENEMIVNLASKSLPTPINFINMQAQKLDELLFTADKKVLSILSNSYQLLLKTSSRLISPSGLLEQNLIGLDNYSRLFKLGISRLIANKINDLNSIERLLSSLSFENILSRGFAIIRSKNNGDIVKSSEEITSEEKIEIQFIDGKKEAIIL